MTLGSTKLLGIASFECGIQVQLIAYILLWEHKGRWVALSTSLYEHTFLVSCFLIFVSKMAYHCMTFFFQFFSLLRGTTDIVNI